MPEPSQENDTGPRVLSQGRGDLKLAKVREPAPVLPKGGREGRTQGESHALEKFPKQQQILKIIISNPVMLTQTLLLLSSVLPQGYMFAHEGSRGVITLSGYFPQTLCFCLENRL